MHYRTGHDLNGFLLARRPRGTIPGYSILILKAKMGHTVRDKGKLLNRVRRIKGQVDAIERALEGEQGCAEVMQLIAATRGAMNGLMAEIIEGHVRDHVASPDISSAAAREEGADKLVEVLRTYLR